jgi:hypothetical protein
VKGKKQKVKTNKNNPITILFAWVLKRIAGNLNKQSEFDDDATR